LDPVGRRFPQPVRPVRLAPDSGDPDTSSSRTPLSRRPVVGLLAALSNVFGPVRLVFSPGLTTFLDPEGSTSRDPLSRDPGTRSSAVLRSDSARFGWCFPRTSRPFSTPEGRLHDPHSRVGRYLVFRRSVSGFGALRSACCPRSLRPVRLPPTSRIPLARDPVLGLVPLSERSRTGSVGVFPGPLGQFGCRRVHEPRSHVTRYLAFRRSLNGCGLVVGSPVFTASSAAAEFARPAFAFLATWPSHRSWDGCGLLRFSVGALTSIPCYGTLGGCTDAVSVCYDGSGRPVSPCRFSRILRYGTKSHKCFARVTDSREPGENGVVAGHTGCPLASRRARGLKRRARPAGDGTRTVPRRGRPP
jgi:hypothetical protein